MSKRPSLELLELRCSKIFIKNEFRRSRSSTTFSVTDPGRTSQILCQVEYGDVDDVNDAVEAAVAAIEEEGTGDDGEVCCWRSLDGPSRGKLLHRLADLVERDADTLAAIEAADSGKPVFMARVADVASAIAVLRAHASFCVSGRGLGGNELPLSGHTGVGLCYTQKEPIGVVAGILPFNFPLCGAVAKIAPALAAGCTIVIKPSDRCPLSALYLCSLITEAGFPPGVVNAVPGDQVTGKALVSHPKIAKVSFTGSTAVGKEIMRLSSDRLARVTLELGGKNACIVCPNSDLAKAAKIACGGNFFNAGQICVGISRVLVPDSVYEEFISLVKVRAEAIVVGDQFDEIGMGPLVDERQLERVLEYIQKGISQGAKVVCGGERIGDTGSFIQPTVLRDVDDDNIVAKEEIFGPVMCIQRYDGDVDKAIKRANCTPFGLAAVVVSNDINTALRVAGKLEAGTVWVNTHGVYDPVAPYQGHKQSGLGSEYGIEGLSAYLKSKTVMVNVGED